LRSFDVVELDAPTGEVIEQLGDLLGNARVDPQFFRTAAESLGWEEVQEWLEDAVPD
jgi:hypothetical protein